MLKINSNKKNKIDENNNEFKLHTLINENQNDSNHNFNQNDNKKLQISKENSKCNSNFVRNKHSDQHNFDSNINDENHKYDDARTTKECFKHIEHISEINQNHFPELTDSNYKNGKNKKFMKKKIQHLMNSFEKFPHILAHHAKSLTNIMQSNHFEISIHEIKELLLSNIENIEVI